MMDFQKIPTNHKENTDQKRLGKSSINKASNSLDSHINNNSNNSLRGYHSSNTNHRTIHNISGINHNNKTLNGSKINMFTYIGYGMIGLLLTTVAAEAMAVDLARFGRGVTEPMVRFATDYWVYGAGIGGIATALLSEGDGRVRIIRGGTVFLGSSAICMGILAAMAP